MMPIKPLKLSVIAPLLLLLSACGEDRTGEYEALIAEDLWIKEQMDDIYLWNEDMPADEKLNFFNAPETFFKSLLSTRCQEGKGDKYSYLETTGTATKSIDKESTYGFDFLLFQPSQTPKQVVARVLFVLKGSPAEAAGLKRGNWITGIDDEVLTKDNYESLYKGRDVTFTLAKADKTGNTAVWTDTARISIAASYPVENNPFHVDSIYRIEGKNIAYLMYNSFSTGPDDDAADDTYNAQMRSIFSRFKGSNVSDFILDLRYNAGGYLSCSQVLASLLAPADRLGQPYCSLVFNSQNTDRDTTYTLREDLTGGNNLNLTKLHVIVGNQTASASEAVINCLRPYMDITLVGTQTEGKNVASLPVQTTEYPDIVLHPIVAIVNNSLGESDYVKGMKPDYEYDETEEAALGDTLWALGDTRELLLKHTLELIVHPPVTEETTPGQATSDRLRKMQLKPILHSADRRQRQAIRLK